MDERNQERLLKEAAKEEEMPMKSQDHPNKQEEEPRGRWRKRELEDVWIETSS